MVVAFIVIAGVGIGWGASEYFSRESTDGDVVSVPSEPAGGETAGAPSSPPVPSGQPTPTETAPALPEDPAEALDQLVETDRKTVIADLDGKWVPQLSSKKLGLQAEGRTWNEAEILAEHQKLREEHPRVQLVWSGDFNSFKEDDFWVTIVGIGYDDPEEALTWCSAHGLGPDHCYAKQLNTSGGYEGTTRLQD
ncbi:hypothetical protein DFO66_102243 [Brevibacterium sanguinis]|uniref:Uncharacterized protein n=2 Tax=Brevibacterium TaxID=1696 RepID=A0A366ING8_9MICO|nr:MULTISPECIES: hypothetical protein [Brevibacterium]RBP67190.1 hypothetical protein DFO66_102243 [Brevibacterium sanguinis]RBP73715.1 hypothetical protein DFO65_102243 [Brevibacterium celere]